MRLFVVFYKKTKSSCFPRKAFCKFIDTPSRRNKLRHFGGKCLPGPMTFNRRPKKGNAISARVLVFRMK